MGTHNEFRSEWEAAGYHQKMGSAAVIRPPSSEFLRVYHVTSAEYALNNISLGRLKVSRFSDLNDPFELFSLNFRQHHVRSMVNSFKDKFNIKMGLLCFSADWTNPVLWSHYGARHRGICLGFNVRKNLLKKVIYEEERIFAEIEKGENAFALDEHIQDILTCTKFEHWRYEEEWRYFVPLEGLVREGSLHFYPFDGDVILSEVILGPQCSISLDAVRKITSVLYPDVSVISSRLAHKCFKIVPEEYSVI